MLTVPGSTAATGLASITAYVRTMANENSPWASKRVHVGRVLADELPATAAAWAKGELGLEHAVVIYKATGKVPDSDLVAALESYLALLAPTLTPAELAAAADDLRSQAEPEESAAETARKHAAQTFHLSQTTRPDVARRRVARPGSRTHRLHGDRRFPPHSRPGR